MTPEKWGVVIDAGSSGTRLRLFHWRDWSSDSLPQIREEQPPNFDDAELLRQRPGLSSFVSHPELAEQQVLSIVTQARRWVPADQQPSTPLYLKATAGLRLVPLAQSEEVLERLRAMLSNRTLCPFRFVSARVISGEEVALQTSNSTLERLTHTPLTLMP